MTMGRIGVLTGGDFLFPVDILFRYKRFSWAAGYPAHWHYGLLPYTGWPYRHPGKALSATLLYPESPGCIPCNGKQNITVEFTA